MPVPLFACWFAFPGAATAAPLAVEVRTNEYFGWRVGRAGDVDADGYPDVVRIEGEGGGNFFGESLAAIDVDGDGWNDLVATSGQTAGRRGRAYLFLGGGL